MKVDNNDFELQYANVLKECITLIEEENRHEREQVSLALKIGEKVNEIVDNIEDEDAVFKRLARDIFKTRGKFIAPSKISEYRQLYLNFESMDTVSVIGNSMMNDLTVGLLTEIASKDMNPQRKSKVDESPLLTMLKRAVRFLDRFEVAIEENQPDEKDMAMIIQELELIRAKDESLLHAVRHTGGKSQLDLFKRRTLPATEINHM
jgi:hypothetical protein